MENLVEELEKQALEAERRAAALRKVAEGAKELGEAGLATLRELIMPHPNGSSPTPLTFEIAGDSQVKPLRGRRAVLHIMRERPGVWQIREIRREMERRGWPASPKSVEVAVARLYSDGELKRVGRGQYVLAESERKEGGIESKPAPWQ